MKVKSGESYPVKYKVAETLASLTREEVEALAVRYLRTAARNFVMGKLNEAEPAIVSNQKMKAAMIASGLGNEEQAKAFFKNLDMPLEIPTEFDIPIADLVPDSEGGRGKKAADIFSYAEVEADETEAETAN